MQNRGWLVRIAGICVLFCGITAAAVAQTERVDLVSSMDGEEQPVLYWAPPAAKQQPTPLFVFLHSWSGDFTQDNSKWLKVCQRENWIWLHPNFRGVNQSPKACGSKFARQDILDAVKWAHEQWRVDVQQVFLAGVSGGGHMSALMAGHHQEHFSAVSSWVGPMDLAEWHRFHTKDGKPQRYAVMIEKSLLGAPGDSAEIDADYRDRSPVFHMHRSGDLPISVWAGINDGHTGSVPVSHSLRVFNGIAQGNGTAQISDTEIEQLVRDRKLEQPLDSDSGEDELLGREILLRRTSRESVITIFDGGHESMPDAAVHWLKQQRRRATVPE